MPPYSAGILLFRGPHRNVFLVHPGGPYWAKRDDGAWSIPKGLVEPDEAEFACAQRELHEETGFTAEGTAYDLGLFTQPGGKRLHVWAVEGDAEPSRLKSNRFTLEWPPKSGRHQSFPEIDRGNWFARDEALRKIVKGQRPVLETFFGDVRVHRPKG